MKRFLLCLTSVAFVVSCLEEAKAGFFSKKSDDTEENTASMCLLGRGDLRDDIQAVNDVKAAYENGKSKFSSADTEMIKYSTDQKAFADKNYDVSMIPLICGVIGLDARCFDTASKAFGLIKEGLDKIKSLGKKRDATKEGASKKAIEQGVQMLQSMKIFRIALNSTMSVAIQLAVNIKADDNGKANSRIFHAVRSNDIQKQLKTLETLMNDGKKKLLSKNIKGMGEAAGACKDALSSLEGRAKEKGTEEMAKLMTSAVASIEDLIAIEGNAIGFISAISEAVCASKDNKLNCAKKLTELHEKCIADHSASTKTDG